jgi:hypothetical protein
MRQIDPIVLQCLFEMQENFSVIHKKLTPRPRVTMDLYSLNISESGNS